MSVTGDSAARSLGIPAPERAPSDPCGGRLRVEPVADPFAALCPSGVLQPHAHLFAAPCDITHGRAEIDQLLAMIPHRQPPLRGSEITARSAAVPVSDCAERYRRGVILSTARLDLRELTASDLPALRAILQDPETMAAYEGAFDEEMVQAWLARMQQRYRDDGFGMWAVILRETGEMIGQCGLTMQHILGEDVVEVGYLFNRAHWHQGYAIEAAAACRDHAFEALGVERVYAQIRDTNLASMNVAIRLGMTVRGRFVKHYRGVDMPHLAFAIHRDDAPLRIIARESGASSS